MSITCFLRSCGDSQRHSHCRHLPSALVAAFIKRLARLSLSAPPAAIVTVIPFIYNLLKLHPGCMTMIHRPTDDVDSGPSAPCSYLQTSS